MTTRQRAIITVLLVCLGWCSRPGRVRDTRIPSGRSDVDRAGRALKAVWESVWR